MSDAGLNLIIRFKPNRMVKKAADRLTESIIRDIFDGRYSPGDALPSERDLAQHFGVHRGSVREALKYLQGIGLVEIKSKGKIRISPFWEKGGVEILSVVLDPDIFGFLSTDWLVDVLNLRKMLWALIADSACMKATEKDVQNLNKLLDKRADTLDASSYLEYDFRFFEAMAKVSGSAAFIWMLNSMGPIYTSLIPRFAPYLNVSPLVDLYSSIVDILDKKDIIKVRGLVLETFDRVDAGLIKRAKEV